MSGPWLFYPTSLHSFREFKSCEEKTPEQCEYYQHRWHFWYEADHVFALPVVYYALAVIALCLLGRILHRLMLNSYKTTPMFIKGLAVFRYLSSRSFRIKRTRWYSPPLGVILLGVISFALFSALILGPQPYYWPSEFPAGVPAHFGHSPPLATRSGWVATGSLPFVIVLPMKLNLISIVTGVSHEKLQVFHRWASWMMFIAALVHTFPFIVQDIEWGIMMENWRTDSLYASGVAALAAQAYLMFFSIGPFRNRFYEFFKATHILVALIFVIFFFIHCGSILSSWDYFIAAAVLYFGPYTLALLRTFLEYGPSLRATLHLTPNDMVQVTIPCDMEWTPGQHVFIRFLTLGAHALTAHPFTICSLSESGQCVFYIKPHGGLTARLAALARQKPGVSVRVFLDGPYGGMQQYRLGRDSDKVTIAAGGSGATFTLPLIEDFLGSQVLPAGIGGRTGEAVHDALRPAVLGRQLRPSKSLNVIVAFRDAETCAWYESEVNEILRRTMGKASEWPTELRICLHVTGSLSQASTSPSGADDASLEKSTIPIQRGQTDLFDSKTEAVVTASNSRGNYTVVKMGRPDLSSIIAEATNYTGRVGIAVCGPEGMLYDVRNAVAAAEAKIIAGSRAGEVYLHTESFGW